MWLRLRHGIHAEREKWIERTSVRRAWCQSANGNTVRLESPLAGKRVRCRHHHNHHHNQWRRWRRRRNARQPAWKEREPALVLRRTRTACAAQHEGFGGAAGWVSRVGFLDLVARPSGQGCRRWRRVTLTRTAAGAHLEGCGDARHEHRKSAQQRLEAKLGERRGPNPFCAQMCSGHARIIRAPGGVWDNFSFRKESRDVGCISKAQCTSFWSAPLTVDGFRRRF
jgi:hypothetical protein